MTIYNKFDDFLFNLSSLDFDNKKEIRFSCKDPETAQIFAGLFRIAQSHISGIESVKEYHVMTVNHFFYISSLQADTLKGFINPEMLLKIKEASHNIMSYIASDWNLPEWKMSDLEEENESLKQLTHVTEIDNLEIYVKSCANNNNDSNFDLLEINRLIKLIAIKRGLYTSEFKKTNKIELRSDNDVLSEESDANLYITGDKRNVLDLIKTIRREMLPQRPKSLYDTCLEFVSNNKVSYENRLHEIPAELVDQIESHLFVISGLKKEDPYLEDPLFMGLDDPFMGID